MIDAVRDEPRHPEGDESAGRERAAEAGSRRTALGWAVDVALMALGPAVILLDTSIRLRTADSFMTKLEPIVVLVIGLPWISLLPIAVAMWLRRTGRRSPGQLISRSIRTARRGHALVDLFPIALAVFACGPLFYATTLGPEGLAMLVGVVVVPVPMLIGTFLSLRRP